MVVGTVSGGPTGVGEIRAGEGLLSSASWITNSSLFDCPSPPITAVQGSHAQAVRAHPATSRATTRESCFTHSLCSHLPQSTHFDYMRHRLS